MASDRSQRGHADAEYNAIRSKRARRRDKKLRDRKAQQERDRKRAERKGQEL